MKYIDYQEHRKHGTFDFPFALYRINPMFPRYMMPLHWHKETELIRIISGEFPITLNGTTYLLTAGQYLFISSGTLHGGSPRDCVYECLVFDLESAVRDCSLGKSEIRKFLDHSLQPDPLYGPDNPYIRKPIDELFDSFIEKAPGYPLVMIGNLYTFLGNVLRFHHYQEKEETDSHTTKKILQYKTVLAFIANHYSEPLTLQALAESIHMNPHYFCRFFKELANCSPIEYLNAYRIEAACEQLYSTQKSITEIALDCGFNDASYFVKVFKKYKGKTPSKYLRP